MRTLLCTLLSVSGAAASALNYPAETQCGGKGYYGSTECPSGFTCEYVDESLSYCVKPPEGYDGKSSVPEYEPTYEAPSDYTPTHLSYPSSAYSYPYGTGTGSGTGYPEPTYVPTTATEYYPTPVKVPCKATDDSGAIYDTYTYDTKSIYTTSVPVYYKPTVSVDYFDTPVKKPCIKTDKYGKEYTTDSYVTSYAYTTSTPVLYGHPVKEKCTKTDPTGGTYIATTTSYEPPHGGYSPKNPTYPDDPAYPGGFKDPSYRGGPDPSYPPDSTYPDNPTYPEDSSYPSDPTYPADPIYSDPSDSTYPDPSATFPDGAAHPTGTGISDPGLPGDEGPYANNSFTPVVGAAGVELRLPVKELRDSYPDVWNMFILALESLQKQKEDLYQSYYQVSGIHGRPNIPWGSPPTPTDRPFGYCTHDSVLFCTWHRPYLVLFEQLLVKHANRIAKTFSGSDRTKYVAAARKVRLPYWDWAVQDDIPDIVTEPNINVVKPGAGSVNIKNPLFSYTFTNDEYRSRYFGDLSSTIADSAETVHGDGSEANIVGHFESRREKTYQLFVISEFSQFSTHRYPGKAKPVDLNSLENIHNDIHSHFSGHMSYIEVSAFDPIFWLHHCNVDRLGAMYQAAFPESVIGDDALVKPMTRISDTFMLPAGGIENIDTPLYPFQHPNKADWTSKDVSSARSIYRFGYAYPEVPTDMQSASDSALSEYTREKVDALYAPDLSGGSFKQLPTPPGGNKTLATALTRCEWLATLIFDPSQIEGSFSVYVYIGDKPTEGSIATSSLVGGCAALSNVQTKVSGTVPLTARMLEAGIPLDPETAVEALKGKISWKIVKSETGEDVPPEKFPSLEVGVSASNVTYWEDPKLLPSYGTWTTYYEITEKKTGGTTYSDKDHLISDDVTEI